MTIDHILENAKSLLHTPYKWGGNNPLEGLDCSGFVRWVLMGVGALPAQDMNSQMIYDYFNDQRAALCTEVQPGALIFYGKSLNAITHIAIAVDGKVVLEAGGGGRTTKTIADAKKKGAMVRMRPFGHRQDCVAVLLPNYEVI